MIWTAIMFKKRKDFQDGRRHHWVMSPLSELFLRTSPHQKRMRKRKSFRIFHRQTFWLQLLQGITGRASCYLSSPVHRKAGSFAILKASVYQMRHHQEITVLDHERPWFKTSLSKMVTWELRSVQPSLTQSSLPAY